MSETELFAALDGLMAYDTGSVDSGIHDDRLKQRCREYLLSLDEAAQRETLARCAAQMLTPERIAQQYGLEDVVEFARWIDDTLLA